jgi:precorrin-6A/cobalt-precorrin-6A reductase
LERGPFRVEDELALLRAHAIDVLVTKASGGEATYAKLAAARALGLPVIMVRRPPPPPGPVVDSVAAALAWLAHPSTAPRSCAGRST